MRILDKSNALLRLEDLGFLQDAYNRFEVVVPEAVRHDPRDRPDRFGQVDHAVRDAQHPERGRPEHHHGRGPGRVPAARHQPGAGQPEGRPDVRRARCARSCAPTPTSCWSVRSATRRRRSIAIEAALTGHLVLSTLHTNDARDAVRGSSRWASSRSSSRPRSTAWSPSGSRGSSASDARRPTQPEPAELRGRGLPGVAAGPRSPSCTGRSGCAACANTGYRGRFGLYEVMPMTEEIERLMVERASTEDIKRSRCSRG